MRAVLRTPNIKVSRRHRSVVELPLRGRLWFGYPKNSDGLVSFIQTSILLYPERTNSGNRCDDNKKNKYKIISLFYIWSTRPYDVELSADVTSFDY